MTLVRAKPSGFGFHDKLTSAQIETIDSQIPDAVDGAGGGTYAPSSAITIGGSGLIMSGGFTSLGVAQFLGSSLTITAPTFIAGATEFATTVLFDTTTTLAAAATFEVANTATLHFTSGGLLRGTMNWATLVINGSAQVDGGLEFASGAILQVDSGATQTVSGTLVVSGTQTMSGTMALTGKIVLSSSGGLVYRETTGATTNTTYHINDGDVIRADPSAGNIVYRLSHTYADGVTPVEDGRQITVTLAFSLANTTNTVDVETFANPGVSLLTNGVALKRAAGFNAWADFMFVTGLGWGCIRYGVWT